MWTAVFKGDHGGELDRVSSKTEEGLKRLLREKIRPEIGWTFAKGDKIEIVEDED